MQLARLVAVAVPLVLGALGACFRDRAPGGTAPQDPAAAAAARFAAAAALAPDPLAFLPVDAQVVVGIDTAQVVRSPVWQRVERRVTQELGTVIAEFRTRCGYDPLAVMRSVTAGFQTLGDPSSGVVVVRGPDRARTLACADAAAAGAGLPVKRLPGGYIEIAPVDASGIPVVMAFIDAATLVMTFGPGASPARLDAALAAGVPLRKSRAFAELWGLVDARQALWFVVSGNLKELEQLAAMGARPRAILGSASLASGLAATARVRFEAPEQAAQISAMAQAQLGVLRAFVDEVEVTAEGADLTARLSLSLQQLEMLVGMAGGVSGP